VFITGSNVLFTSENNVMCACPSFLSYKTGPEHKCAVALQAAREGFTWQMVHYMCKRDKRYAQYLPIFRRRNVQTECGSSKGTNIALLAGSNKPKAEIFKEVIGIKIA
jgi:hypothetical protein